MTSTINSDKVYVDFPTNFDFHPIKKDLSLITNENAVKRSIRNLLQTNFYERNDPTVGADLISQLFELATPLAQIVVRDSIVSCINNHEPRANLISVDVAVDPDQHSVVATIVFSILNNSEPTSLSVLLTRVR